MGIVFLALSSLFSLLLVGGVIYTIISLVKNKEKRINLTKNTLLNIYFYLVSLITLGIAVIGSVTFLNSVFSYKIGVPFSYEVQELNKYDKDTDLTYYDENSGFPICYIGKPIEIGSERVCFDQSIPKKALITGLSFTVSMLILFVIHRIGIRTIEKKEKFMWIKKAYNFISLTIYSVISIVAIPISTYLILNYIYFRPETLSKIDPPGYMLALATVSVPLWIYFLIRTLRLKEEK